MKRIHVPDLHIARLFTEAFEHALHHDEPDAVPPRDMPAAQDWPEWHWDPTGGRW